MFANNISQARITSHLTYQRQLKLVEDSRMHERGGKNNIRNLSALESYLESWSFIIS